MDRKKYRIHTITIQSFCNSILGYIKAGDVVSALILARQIVYYLEEIAHRAGYDI